MDPISMTLPGGAQAEVRETSGERATVKSPQAFPPGSTIRAQIEGVVCEFQLKVRDCRKENDAYVIEGRVINATREMKDLLRAKM